MNQHVRLMDLTQLAFVAIAALMPDKIAELPEPAPAGFVAAATAARLAPGSQDRAMVGLADALGMTTPELLALAVLAAVETDPQACRTVALCQSPLGGARPLVGLFATAFAGFGTVRSVMLDIAAGVGQRCGCFRLSAEDAPLPERSMAIALPILHALLGNDQAMPGVELMGDTDASELPASILAQIKCWTTTHATEPQAGLVIRAAHEADAKAVAVGIACSLGRKPVWIVGELPAGFAPWLIAIGALPVFAADLRPGECRIIPSLLPYEGPWVCLAGRDGSVSGAHDVIGNWLLDIPCAAERIALWNAGGLPDSVSRRAAVFLQGPARIAEIAAAARHSARHRGAAEADWTDMERALATESHAALDGLAERVRGTIEADALVAPPLLSRNLTHLLDHCRLRDGLSGGLGHAAMNNFGRGVRALFHGPSGTGKSLAAHWLASRLAMALYRVDLGAIMSKWIGETEKNLGQLLAAAEHSNVILLFDEADALFGARTDVNSANDKFANGQTNYLLQRLETWEGIVVLTSNARERLDSAFTRRLDSIIEFPMPDALARLKMWQAHIGDGSTLSPADFNHLAAGVDLAGGHIRNIVLGACVAARSASRTIHMEDVIAAAQAEYAKLGRSVPHELG